MDTKGQDMTHQELHVVLGAGPMGRAIARTLAAEGRRVRLVTRDGRPLGTGSETARADLSDAGATVVACEGASAIYQCAAPPYHLWQTAFPAIQEAAIEAAARSGAVLVAVENLYGYGVAGSLHEGMPLEAITRKGRLRADLSARLLKADASGKARTVAGRATDFFGPEVTMSALGGRFWPALLVGRAVDWTGDPDAPHSFAYLPDLARAYVALAGRPQAWGRAWHLPTLPPMSVREICAMARPAGAAPMRIRKTPSWVLRAVGLFQPAAGEMVEMRYMFDAPFVTDHAAFDRLMDETGGWTGTPARSAIEDTAAWWASPQAKAA